MVCTLEAVFSAGWEVNEALYNGNGDPFNRIGDLFTIFGFMKCAVEKGMEKKTEKGLLGGEGGGKEGENVDGDGSSSNVVVVASDLLPWTEEYKALKRQERKQAGSERQKKQKDDSKKLSKEERSRTDTRHYKPSEGDGGGKEKS